jgi:hypothetical protein
MVLAAQAVMIAAFPAAETVLVVLAGFPVSQAPVLRGMPDAPAQGRSVSPDRIGAPNMRVRSLDAHGGVSTARGTARRSIHGRSRDGV